MNDLISVIIPVYNAEKYLNECMSSVLNQTYSNLEIILINDGSTDSSLAICKKIAEEDKRIILIDNVNHGVSFSRNCGIKQASGKYLTFVDSDDVIDRTMFDVLIKNIKKTGAEMSCCSFIEKTGKFSFSYESKYVKETEKLYKRLLEKYRGFLCTKLYITEIIKKNNLLLDISISSGEDLLFNSLYLKFITSVVFTESKLYGYRIVSTSLSRGFSQKWFDLILVYKNILSNVSMDRFSKKTYIWSYLIVLFEAKYRCKIMRIALNTVTDRYGVIYKDEVKKYYFRSWIQSDVVGKIKLTMYRFFPYVTHFLKNRKENR